MKPKELLERLRLLSIKGKVTDVILYAPLSAKGEGDVTCADLIDFCVWVGELQENSWKYEDLKR